jgi:hypothetical protein
MQKVNLDTDLTPITKSNSKCIRGLNTKCKTMKLFEDNIRKNLDYLGFGDDFFGDDFLDITSRVQIMKEIIDKLNPIKIFCSKKLSRK